MSEYRDEDYFAIYLRCIRADRSVPFDCYILLKHANRIVLWVRKGGTFPQSKHEKVQGRSIDKVYIRVEDKSQYFQYLDSFLVSKEGQESLAEILSSEGELPQGLPSPEEHSLAALASKDEKTKTFDEVSLDTDTDPDNREITFESTSELGAVEVKSSEEDSETGAVNVQPEIDGPIGEAIHAIRSEVRELEEVTVKGWLKEVEDKKVIENCTLSVQEELVKVEGILKKEKSIDGAQVEAIRNKFDQQVQIIRGTAGEESFQLISSSIEDINDRIDELHKGTKSKKSNPRKLRKKIKTIKNQINSLSRVAQKDPQAIVSRTVNRILGSLEQKLGERITLDTSVGQYDELPEHLSRQMDLDDVMEASSEDIKIFQHQIVKQSLIIQELEAKYGKSRQSLKTLRDKWFLFHVQAKKNLTGGDILAARDIEREFQQLEREYGELQSDSDILIAVAQELTDSMGGQHIEIDPQLLAEIGALNKEEQEKLKARIHEKDFEKDSQVDGVEETNSIEDQALKDEGETGSSPRQTMDLGELADLAGKSGSVVGGSDIKVGSHVLEELEHLSSENEILKTQLENSQNLLDSANNKIEELNQLIERNNELTENIEAENDEYRRLITNLDEKVEKFQSAENMYNDTMSDAGKEIKSTQAHLENQKDIIADLRDQLDLRAKEVEGLKQNAKLDEAFQAKEQRLEKLTRSLADRQEEIVGLKKEIINLTAKMNNFQQKYKHIAHKMDRVKGEQEALRKASRAAQTKAEGSTNALKQARKTINKLTVMSDDLRKDRQTYIRKTNENMAKYRSMMSQAANLTRQVEATTKVNAELEEKLKKSQHAEKKLREEIQTLKLNQFDLEEKVKKAG